MLTELRNFLAIPYDELEEMNVKAKKQRLEPCGSPQNSGGAAQISHRRVAHQGRDRDVQRPRRPPAHAGLRQEISAEELRQPDI